MSGELLGKNILYVTLYPCIIAGLNTGVSKLGPGRPVSCRVKPETLLDFRLSQTKDWHRETIAAISDSPGLFHDANRLRPASRASVFSFSLSLSALSFSKVQPSWDCYWFEKQSVIVNVDDVITSVANPVFPSVFKRMPERTRRTLCFLVLGIFVIC